MFCILMIGNESFFVSLVKTKSNIFRKTYKKYFWEVYEQKLVESKKLKK